MSNDKKQKQGGERIVETKDGRRFRVSEEAEMPDEKVTVLARAIAKELRRLDEESEKEEKPKRPRSLLDAFLSREPEREGEEEQVETE